MEPLSDSPKVSVVILNWNRKDDIRETLEAMLRQSYSNLEIIVADNDSTDGAPEMIEELFPQVKLIKLPRNIGIEGYNIAIKNAKGALIVILDNDSFLEPDGVQKVVDKFRQFPDLGVVACKVKYFPSNVTHHWHPFITSEDGPDEGYDAPLFNGCAAAVRKDILDEVGYYPEEFFLYENEKDLTARIVNKGYKVRYFLDILAYHKVSPVARKTSRRTYYKTRNDIWYFLKYYPAWIFIPRIGKVVLKELYEALQNRTVLSYFKGLVDAVIGIPMILRKRQPVKREYFKTLLY